MKAHPDRAARHQQRPSIDRRHPGAGAPAGRTLGDPVRRTRLFRRIDVVASPCLGRYPPTTRRSRAARLRRRRADPGWPSSRSRRRSVAIPNLGIRLIGTCGPGFACHRRPGACLFLATHESEDLDLLCPAPTAPKYLNRACAIEREVPPRSLAADEPGTELIEVETQVGCAGVMATSSRSRAAHSYRIHEPARKPLAWQMLARSTSARFS